MEVKINVVLLEAEAKMPMIKSKLFSLSSYLEFQQNDSIENLFDGLLSGSNDVAVLDLADIGKMSDELCIAALSERSEAHYILYIKNASLDKTRDLRVKENATFGVINNLLGIMVNQLRPDCEYDIIGNKDFGTSEWTHDAIITNLNVALESHQRFDLQPSEFPPKAGKGVSAFICRKDNLSLRKSLATLHEAAVSICTNVERSIENRLSEENVHEAGVFCEQDKNGNYHVYLNYLEENKLFKSIKYSQSTNYQLVEKVIDLIKNN